MVSSATENDQLVGKRNASRTPLRRPSKSSTLMSPTGKLCAQDRPQWRSMIHTRARTSETHRIAEAQKKRASRKARLYSTSSTSAGPTYPCPECGRALQARIGLISHLRTHRVNKTGHHHHHREVMVIIGNDRRTTFTMQAAGEYEVYRCRQHDNISMELVEECVKRRLRRCYRNCHASIGHRRSWRSNETCQ